MSDDHTKGPWKVTMSNAPFGVHPTNRVISFRIGHENFTDKAYFTEEDEANACLIEHAPDMLEGLKKCLHTFEVTLGYESQTIMLRELIAKAKGN